MATTLERIQYGFDSDSRRTWRKRALATGEDHHYNYDGLSQVVTSNRVDLNLNCSAVAATPKHAESWEYDPTGNWHGYHVEEDGAVVLEQNREHDKGNRLTQIKANSGQFLLDRTGRMTQASPDASGDWDEPLNFKWDAWSRLTEVRRVSDDTVLGKYGYDGLGRRITREVASVVHHSYYSANWKPLEEREGGGTAASIQYFWGARHRDDLVRRDRDSDEGGTLDETRYVLMDYFSPAAITDEDGVVTERYDFTAFGIRRMLAPNFIPRSVSECDFEFGFQGQFLDAESGLLNYGYRYYSAQLGRWTRKDPIGESGGSNLYQAMENNPVQRVDYLGLDPVMERGKQAAQNAYEKTLESDPDWRKQVEYCGAICQDDVTGSIQTTGPRTDNSTSSCDPGDCPDCTTKVGTYHSHPGDCPTSYQDYAYTPQGQGSFVGTASGVYQVNKGKGKNDEPVPYGCVHLPGGGTAPHPPLQFDPTPNDPTDPIMSIPVLPFLIPP